MSNNIELSCTSNIISSKNKCQTLTDIVPDNETILYNISNYIQDNFSKIDIKVTGFLIIARYNYKDIHHAQATIARKVGCSREHVNRTLKKLKKLGLVNYIYRHMTSCRYKLSSFFDQRETRKQLRKYFSILWYLPVIWLMPSEPVFNKNITQLKNLYEYKLEILENRHSIFEFNNFQKLNFDEKRGDLDLKAFSDTLDNAFNQSHNLAIPDYIESLAPILELTGYGKAYLSCFSFEAISFAVRRILVKAELTGNPWNYFNKLLTIYCQEHNVEANWDNLPEVPRPITGDLRSIDKVKLKKWVASCSSLLKKGKEKQAFNKSQAYCCGNCQLNKTHPVYGSGRIANRICNIERKKNAGQPGYNNAGELFSEAKKNLYTDWSTLEGVKRFGQTVKLLGYPTVKLIINSMLDPVDWLPEEEPKDLVSYIYAKASSPF